MTTLPTLSAAVCYGNENSASEPLLTPVKEEHQDKDEADTMSFRWTWFFAGFAIAILLQACCFTGLILTITRPGDGTALGVSYYLLSNIDTFAYLLICSAFTYSSSKLGYENLKTRFEWTEDYSRKALFHASIQSLIGIVMGSFLVWIAIDIVLGLPVAPEMILWPLGFDLILCALMIWCYEESEEEGELEGSV